MNKGVNSQKKPPKNKSGILKSAMVATALLSTQVQAGQLLKTDPVIIAKCDKNGDAKINTKLDVREGLVSKNIAKIEYKCSLKIKGLILDKDIAGLEEDIIKIIEIKGLLGQQ